MSGYGWRQSGGSPAGILSARSRGTCGNGRVRPAWQVGGTEALQSKGSVSREWLSPQRCSRLEAEDEALSAGHGFSDDRRYALGRINTLIGRLFHVRYTVEGTWKRIRRRGWSAVPVAGLVSGSQAIPGTFPEHSPESLHDRLRRNAKGPSVPAGGTREQRT